MDLCGRLADGGGDLREGRLKGLSPSPAGSQSSRPHCESDDSLREGEPISENFFTQSKYRLHAGQVRSSWTLQGSTRTTCEATIKTIIRTLAPTALLLS